VRDVGARTLEGRELTLKGSEIEALQEGIRGRVITPESSDYDAARRIWNSMIDRRPALIIRPAGAADILTAVRFARQKGLLTSVRGGGHNIAGNAVCDGGLMVDLSAMRSVQVDPAARRATVEAGATLGDFDREAQVFGLATPVGINSTTGLAGLTLGGGYGWLSRKYGLTVDNLLSASVITADGRLVKASPDENPDLFWAIRGGGGNFGIVSRFEFQLHPVGPQVYAGLVAYPLEQGQAVLKGFREFMASAPNELAAAALPRKAPPLPFLPAEVHGRNIVVMAFCYCGDPARAEAVTGPLGTFGKPYGSLTGPMPYTAWQQVTDPLNPPGARNYWKSHNLTILSDRFIDTIIGFTERLPSDLCEMPLLSLGGQISRLPADSTAYPHRDATYVMNVHGRWEEPGQDEQVIQWARDLWSATEPDATGGIYINFMTADEAGRVPSAAYGPAWKRLTQIKARWDPDNFFRMNHNIPPAV
jgi:FAD/FMN-containing dehydrogenase